MDTSLSALIPTADRRLCYDPEQCDDLIVDLCKGGIHLFYGAGGTGKTHEVLRLVDRADSLQKRVVMTALSNDAASRLRESKGLYLTFGLRVDATGKTAAESKMDELCRSIRRANPQRTLDPLWDDQQPTKKDMDNFNFTKSHLTAKGLIKNIHIASDADLIASINASTSRYLQRDCADAYRTITRAQFVVLEEIFTISDPLLSLLEALFRKYRRDDRPFGGCGLLMSGDIMQTKPIKGAYVHTGALWQQLNPVVHLFGTFKRFKPEDTRFIELLTRARRGCITDEDHELLLSRKESVLSRNTGYSICRTREQAAQMNMTEYQKLIDKGVTPYVINSRDAYYTVSTIVTANGSEEQELHMITGEASIEMAKRVLGDVNKSTELVPQLRVAVGARFMIRHNDRVRGINNGSIGTVTEIGMVKYTEDEVAANGGRKGRIDWIELLFDREFAHNILETGAVSVGDERTLQTEYGERHIIVQRVEGDTVYSKDRFRIGRVTMKATRGGYAVHRTQFPGDLCWGLTMYKSQGRTVDECGMVVFAGRMNPGEAYVGLSRFTTLEHIVLNDNYTRGVFYAHPEALDFDTQIQEKGQWTRDPSTSTVTTEYEDEDDDDDERQVTDDMRAFMLGH